MSQSEFPCYDSLEEDDGAPPSPIESLERVVARELLPRTSPVVGWDAQTMIEVRRLRSLMKGARADNDQHISRLPELQAEMEAAWDAK